GGVTYFNGTSSVTSNAGSFFWDASNNRLGIGTSNPTRTLDVVGTANFSGNTGVGGSLNLTSAGVFSAGLTVAGHTGVSTLSSTGNVGIGGTASITSLANLLSGLVVSGHSSLSTLSTSGNVGIGAS